MLLQATNLTKIYPGGVVALQDFSCNLDKGFVGVVGPNAAGKTTLLKLLAGLEAPTAGKVSFAGLELPKNKLLLHSAMGYLPQEFGFYNSQSGEAMLDYIAFLKGIVDSKKRRDSIDEVLAMVNLNSARKVVVGQYSFGMKKRLGIAQSLLGSPRLLILDEPMEGLDPEENIKLGSLIAEIASERLVVVATHSLCDVDGCKIIVVLRRGETLFQGTPEKLAELADGLVWRMEVEYQQAEQLKMLFRVIGVQQKNGKLALRLLSKQKPAGWKAITVKARLEEGYMALISDGAG